MAGKKATHSPSLPYKRGVYCHACGHTRFRSNGYYKPLRGVTFRYFICRKCGTHCTFKVTMYPMPPKANGTSAQSKVLHTI